METIQKYVMINGGTEIERVQEFNYLGIQLNEHLTWKKQKIANKISRSIGILNKLKRCLPQNKYPISFV